MENIIENLHNKSGEFESQFEEFIIEDENNIIFAAKQEVPSLRDLHDDSSFTSTTNPIPQPQKTIKN